MPDKITEVRCPTDRKLLIGLSRDFVGIVSTKCPKCKQDVVYPRGAVAPDFQMRCACNAWIIKGVVERGSCRGKCHRCRGLAAFNASGYVQVERPRRDAKLARKIKAPSYQEQRIVDLIQQRWKSHTPGSRSSVRRVSGGASIRRVQPRRLSLPVLRSRPRAGRIPRS